MASTVINFLPINLISLLCGLKLGVAGNYLIHFTTFHSILFLTRRNKIRFNEFGGTVHERPVQDLAFAVARFVRTGGSFINYYMVLTSSNFSSHHGFNFFKSKFYWHNLLESE